LVKKKYQINLLLFKTPTFKSFTEDILEQE
jgi:hypothetical protein